MIIIEYIKMTSLDATNINTNTELSLNVRGDIIKAPIFVVEQIPFLSSLIETGSDKPIYLDQISPSFLIILIDHLKNEMKVDYLRTQLDKFPNKNIKKYLKYLCMVDLLSELNLSNIDIKFNIQKESKNIFSARKPQRLYCKKINHKDCTAKK